MGIVLILLIILEKIDIFPVFCLPAMNLLCLYLFRTPLMSFNKVSQFY